MKKLKVYKKTGFVNVSDSPIIIYDHRGIIFYNSSFLKKRVKQFNLPKGLYFIKSGVFTKLPRPVKFNNKPLTFPDRFRPSKPVTVKFGTNLNKASIFTMPDKQVILFDKEFKNKPMYIIMYIFFHEHGHNLYKSEFKADSYARWKMLKRGYNPSQIGLASIKTLSSRKLKRKKNIVHSLTKN